MKLVVDVNILFAILIKEGKTEDILFQDSLQFLGPELLFEEFEKYKGEIILKTNRSSKDFERLIVILKKKIKEISYNEIVPYIEDAKKCCPDEKDIDYFALAIKLNCSIWSNVKKLKEQLKVKIYLTEEIMQEFEL